MSSTWATESPRLGYWSPATQLKNVSSNLRKVKQTYLTRLTELCFISSVFPHMAYLSSILIPRDNVMKDWIRSSWAVDLWQWKVGVREGSMLLCAGGSKVLPGSICLFPLCWMKSQGMRPHWLIFLLHMGSCSMWLLFFAAWKYILNIVTETLNFYPFFCSLRRKLIWLYPNSLICFPKNRKQLKFLFF